MMRLEYAGGTLITGDEIADAIVRYAAALGVANTAVAIDVPGVTADGVSGTFQILIGPASQIMVEPTDEPGEIRDDEFVTHLNAEIELLQRPRVALPFDDNQSLSATDEFE
jgi:hypothetical protein